MLLETILSIILIFLLAIFFIWLSSAFFGAPFQPTSDKALKLMIKLSEIKSSNKKKIKLADLGSGNGKIILAFAKLNPKIEAHGFEINPLLVWVSRIRIKRAGLKDKVFVHTKNFWKQNFKDFDIITSFQINYAMPGLEKKFQKELHKGTKVISDTWKFPHWEPKEKLSYGLGNIFLYVKE